MSTLRSTAGLLDSVWLADGRMRPAKPRPLSECPSAPKTPQRATCNAQRAFLRQEPAPVGTFALDVLALMLLVQSRTDHGTPMQVVMGLRGLDMWQVVRRHALAWMRCSAHPGCYRMPRLVELPPETRGYVLQMVDWWSRRLGEFLKAQNGGTFLSLVAGKWWEIRAISDFGGTIPSAQPPRLTDGESAGQ